MPNAAINAKDNTLNAKHKQKSPSSLKTSDEEMLKEVKKIATEPIGTEEQTIENCVDRDVMQHVQLTMSTQECIEEEKKTENTQTDIGQSDNDNSDDEDKIVDDDNTTPIPFFHCHVH